MKVRFFTDEKCAECRQMESDLRLACSDLDYQLTVVGINQNPLSAIEILSHAKEYGVNSFPFLIVEKDRSLINCYDGILSFESIYKILLSHLP